MAPEEWDPYTDIEVPDAGDYRVSQGDTILTRTEGRGLTSRRVSSA